MRVDTGSPAAPSANDLDALAQFKRYLQALRRKWYLLAVFTVVGAGLGWVSAPASSSTEILNRTRHYEAVHTVIRGNAVNAQNTAGAYQPTLPQTAYLVGAGDVPAAVARQLSLEVSEVEGSVVGIPRNEVSSIEIKAIGTNKERVVELADTSAQVLIEQLDAEARLQFETARDEVVTRLDRLESEVNAINLQLINDPESPQLIAQQRSLTNQYSLAYEQFTQLANQPVPSANLSSLQQATAQEISESAFDKAKDEIATGLPYVTGAASTVPEGGGGGTGAPNQGASAVTRALLGAIVGLGLAVGLVLALDRFDNRLRHREGVEQATGLPVLAEIPPLTRHQQHDLEVVAHTQHRSRAAEAYRVVRSALLFAVETDTSEHPHPEGEALVVMVTSANPEEGKTTTVANMAAVLAEGGFRVLVINCDFRRPRVHKYLVADPDKHQDQPSAADPANATRVAVSATAIERVKLITGVGEHDPNANPLDVVAMQRKVIQMARGRYDVILLDTAPFLTTNDASELLSETDHVLLVVRAGKTRRLAAHRTAEILERFDAPVLGVVMNDSDETPAAQYYYTYYLDGSGKKKRTDGYVSHSSGVGSGGAPQGNGSTPAPLPEDRKTAGLPTAPS